MPYLQINFTENTEPTVCESFLAQFNGLAWLFMNLLSCDGFVKVIQEFEKMKTKAPANLRVDYVYTVDSEYFPCFTMAISFQFHIYSSIIPTQFLFESNIHTVHKCK